MSIFTSGSVSPPRTATATPSSERSFGSRQSPLRPLDVDVHLVSPLRAHGTHATSDYGSNEGSHIQQCIRCLHYGHDRCRRKPRCFRCGSFEHVDPVTCTLPVICLNCGGPHHSRHPACPSRLRELTIQQLVHKQGLCRKEAVQMAASFGVDTSSSSDPHFRIRATSEQKRNSGGKSVAVQTDPPPTDAATQTDCIDNSTLGISSTTPLLTGGYWGYSVYPCYPVQVIALNGSYPTTTQILSTVPGLGAGHSSNGPSSADYYTSFTSF